MPATLNETIRTIYKEGCYSGLGRRAIRRLVAGGARGLDAFLEAQTNPPDTDNHPVDVADTIFEVFAGFASSIPDILINRFEKGKLSEFCIYWALGSARGGHSIDVLIAGLKSKDPFSRWGAAESLIQRRSKRAVPMLIAALTDRASMVKFTVVQAMKSNKMYRRHEALPALRRILASKSMRKHSPGTVATAQEVIAMLETTVNQ